MRGAGARIARQIVGIVDRAHHRLFEARGHLIGRHRGAHLEAPGSIRERLGRRTRDKRRRQSDRTGYRAAAPEQGAPIDEAIAGNRRRVSIRLSRETAHGRASLLPGG